MKRAGTIQHPGPGKSEGVHHRCLSMGWGLVHKAYNQFFPHEGAVGGTCGRGRTTSGIPDGKCGCHFLAPHREPQVLYSMEGLLPKGNHTADD